MRFLRRADDRPEAQEDVLCPLSPPAGPSERGAGMSLDQTESERLRGMAPEMRRLYTLLESANARCDLALADARRLRLRVADLEHHDRDLQARLSTQGRLS